MIGKLVKGMHCREGCTILALKEARGLSPGCRGVGGSFIGIPDGCGTAELEEQVKLVLGVVQGGSSKGTEGLEEVGDGA